MREKLGYRVEDGKKEGKTQVRQPEAKTYGGREINRKELVVGR